MSDSRRYEGFATTTPPRKSSEQRSPYTFGPYLYSSPQGQVVDARMSPCPRRCSTPPPKDVPSLCGSSIPSNNTSPSLLHELTRRHVALDPASRNESQQHG